jgi:hypothetical protein
MTQETGFPLALRENGRCWPYLSFIPKNIVSADAS